MSRRDYLPEPDADLAAWCANFTDTIAADPACYGLSAADAAQLASARATFDNALATALDPATRTPVAVTAKNLARHALERAVRAAARRVQSFPGTTAEDRAALGLSDRAARPSRIAPPVTRPLLLVDANPPGGVARLRILDESAPLRLAFPPGVESAVVFTCALPPGTPPPASLDDWRFEGIATRSLFPLPERPADAALRVYAMAFWTSPRGEPGPRSLPLVLSPGVIPAAAA
jgi:hypothetical protein